MKELNNTVKYKKMLLASGEVQCSVLFSDNTKKHCTSLEGRSSFFNDAETKNIVEFAAALKEAFIYQKDINKK